MRWGTAMGTQQAACEAHPTAPRRWGLRTALLSLTRSGIPSTAVRPQGLALQGSVHPKPLSARDALVPWISRRLTSMTCPLGTHLAVIQLGLTFPRVLGGIPGQGQERPRVWGLQAPKVQENKCPPGLVLGVLRGWLGPREHLGPPAKQDSLSGRAWQARGPTDRHLDPHHLLGASQLPRIPKAGD